MSRHRSPRGRIGETTSVAEPDASVPQPRVGQFDQGTAEYRLGTPSLESALMLPRPRISQSGPMAVIGSPDPGPMGPDLMGPDLMGPDLMGPDLMGPDL
ncbi:MAG: hypothetical protein QOI75_6177, partial [Pseudonocardiales bacterium]|nr:hypothetical protein [Pseudonocardiales bacterium]